MEQQTNNIFQITSRSATVSTNNSSRPLINDQLAKVQADNNLVFDNINEAFSWLLQFAIQATNNEPANPQVTEVIPEFAVVLHENADQEAEFSAALTAISDYHVALLDSEKTPEKLIKKCVHDHLGLHGSLDRHVSHKDSLNEKIKELEQQIADSKNAPIPEPEGLQLDLNEKQLLILKAISERRKEKLRLPDQESIEELIVKMTFNDGTIFDLSNEFYTGLSGLFKRKTINQITKS